MKTRAQVIASHCAISRVPVEIITQILKLIPSELRAVSGTCRYLRAIASPLLYQEMTIAPTKRSSFAPLEDLGEKGRKERADLLRLLQISEFKDPRHRPSTHRILSFSTIIVASLDFLSNLGTISLPFPLLTDSLFRAIYNHPSIHTLEIVGHARDFGAGGSLNIHSRLPLPPRTSILTVPQISTELGDEGPITMRNLSTFLLFHSVVVPTMYIGLDYTIPLDSIILDYPPLLHLTTLKLLVLPDGFDTAVDFLQIFIKAQPSLQPINLRLTEVVNGFPNENALISFKDGDVYQPLPSFAEAWAGVKVRSIATEFTRDAPEEDFLGDAIEFDFFPSTTITPWRARALAEQTRNYDTLSFKGDDLVWSDWTSILANIVTNIHYLGGLEFEASLTPILTVTTTLACSPSCYKKLATSHPSLHAASELVGGYLVVWQLAYDLNIARLKQLAPLLSHHGGRVFWNLNGKGGQALVDVVTAVNEAGVWSSWKDEVKLSTEEKVKLCRCVGCGEVKDGDDPLSALMACGGREVRVALVVGGFDLDAFDSRTSTSPNEQDEFECFLRSNTY